MWKNVKILTCFNTNEFSSALLPVSFDLGEWYMYLCKAGVQIQNSFCCHHGKAVKPRVKCKAKAKAKAASQPSGVEANDVSRAEVSKFITALKCKAKNPKDTQAQGAQMVLEDRGYKKK